MNAGPTPVWLLDQARALLARPDAATAGRWPRAAALLGRQALEARLDQVLDAKAAGLSVCSARAKLLCLPLCVEDDTATAVAHAWSALTRACHHHAYELPPTAEELGAVFDVVAAFTAG